MQTVGYASSFGSSQLDYGRKVRSQAARERRGKCIRQCRTVSPPTLNPVAGNVTLAGWRKNGGTGWLELADAGINEPGGTS